MTINNKQRRDELPDAYAQYDADVVVETWELQENKFKNSHLGLAAFLNKQFQIKRKKMKDNKDCIVNSRVGNKHKMMLRSVMQMTDLNQSEFLRFAIEEGYKNILMNCTLANAATPQNWMKPL